MKLREYEYMLAIAREENMTKAAQTLYVSQSALSKLLSRLEHELGAKLFEYSGHRMIPTDFGRFYLENAAKIVQINDRFERDVRGFAARRDLIMAYPMAYSGYMTGSVLPALYSAHADLSVQCCITPQCRILERMIRGDWPVALGLVTEENAKALSFLTVGYQEMVLAVPRGHALSSLAIQDHSCTFPRIFPPMLAGIPFLLPRSSSYSGCFAQNYFRIHGIHPPVVLRLPMTGLLFQSVAAGAGVAFVPSVPLQSMHLEDAITYLSVEKTQERCPVGLLFKAEHRLSPQEEALYETMLSHPFCASSSPDAR